MLRLIQFKANEFGFVREANPAKAVEIGALRESRFAAREDAIQGAIEAGYWFDREGECAREH